VFFCFHFFHEKKWWHPSLFHDIHLFFSITWSWPRYTKIKMVIWFFFHQHRQTVIMLLDKGNASQKNGSKHQVWKKKRCHRLSSACCLMILKHLVKCFCFSTFCVHSAEWNCTPVKWLYFSHPTVSSDLCWRKNRNHLRRSWSLLVVQLKCFLEALSVQKHEVCSSSFIL